MTTVALTIAGSDSGGGAGIQQDLKVFEAFGVWGATAVTAVTAQDAREVRALHVLPADVVGAQIDAVAAGLRPAAAKTGMLADGEIVRAVCAALERHRIGPVVVDPVVAASDGTALLDSDGVALVRDLLLPLASVVTPNASEAAALTGLSVDTVDDQERAARLLCEMGAAAALVTGGHVGSEATDVLFDGTEAVRFTGTRIAGGPVHGTGCVLSAALAAGLARGRALRDATADAKAYVTGAIERARRFHGDARAADAAWRSRPPGH